MSEKGIDSYRFLDGTDPTDEMLRRIMQDAAEEAQEQSRKAYDSYFAEMLRDIEVKQIKWGDRINCIIDGRE